MEYTIKFLKTSDHARNKGTAPWTAYELVKFVSHPTKAKIVCTEASDVWAFGMVLYVRHGLLFISRDLILNLFP